MLVVHALGVPLAFTVVAALGAPAFLIGLWHVGLKVDALRVFEIAVNSLSSAGLMLGGLAPLTALVLVSSEEAWGAAAFVWCALLISGAMAVRTLFREARQLFAGEQLRVRVGAYAVAIGFALLASLLALRVFTMTLPALSFRSLAQDSVSMNHPAPPGHARQDLEMGS
jgi:hypothetical protein